uniref:RNase_PH domain-containing protein n=1 Tax=Rhabditophanes sp. KR3021 TaxID=114890 RepID=A0AC35TJR3_9BILA
MDVDLSRKKILTNIGYRSDGRLAKEMRHISYETGIQMQAQGSVSWKQGLTELRCAVFGPGPIRNRGRMKREEVYLNIVVNQLPFATRDRKRSNNTKRDRQQQVISRHLETVFKKAIVTELYPKSQIDIYIDILLNDGSAMAACMNAVSVSLASASIPLRYVPTAITCGYADNDFVVDLNGDEEMLNLCRVTLTTKNGGSQVVAIDMKKKCDAKVFDQLVAVAASESAQVNTILSATMLHYAETYMRRVFVVTGANKGVGYGIVRNLLKKVESTKIYLTARDEGRGNEAVKCMLTEFGGRLDKSNEVKFHQLDITKDGSVNNFAKYLKDGGEKIDVLINNAGFAFDNDAKESALEQAQYTIDVNYYGTKRVSNALIPLIKEGGRLVNVTSMMGKMISGFSKENVALFNNDTYTVETIDKFVEDYKKYCEPDTRKQHGYNNSAYRTSKVAEMALTMLQHRQLKDRNILVNGCCPGYVNTDMTNHKGPLTIDQGAETPIFCAISEQAPNGKFLEKCAISKWI